MQDALREPSRKAWQGMAAGRLVMRSGSRITLPWGVGSMAEAGCWAWGGDKAVGEKAIWGLAGGYANCTLIKLASPLIFHSHINSTGP